MKHIKKYKTFNEGVGNEQDYFNEVSDKLKCLNLRPVVLTRILDFYEDEIMNNYDNGVPADTFISKISKNMELTMPPISMPQTTNIPTNMSTKTIKYL